MRKTTLVTVQGKKTMSYTELIVLSDSQYKKLALYEMGKRLAGLEELRKGIDNLAKDLHVNWSIENNGNVHIICIERTTTDPIDDAKYHDLEIAAANFMSAIDKMELPKEKDEPECPSHEPDKVNCDEEEKAQDAETLKFVEKLLHDINLPREDDRHVCGALIIDTTTHPVFVEPTCWGNMSYDLLKEMCELYLNNHKLLLQVNFTYLMESTVRENSTLNFIIALKTPNARKPQALGLFKVLVCRHWKYYRRLRGCNCND